MKTGRTLTEFAKELERQQESKRDFVADTRQLRMSADLEHAGQFGLEVNGHGQFDVTDNTHRQIAQRVGIPQKYYDRMRAEAPQLLTGNVQHWFHANAERRMVRTLDGRARAFLSDRYRPLDNFDLAQIALPILLEGDGIKIESTQITESRMYIKALFPKIETEIARGDVVQSGIVISNSEIGHGALKVEPLVYRLVCLNGMIAADHSTKKYHIGRAADGGDLAYELYSDETLRADDEAFWRKIADAIRGSLSSDGFEKIVERMREATSNKIVGDPVAAVEVVATRFGLNDGERAGVLRHLIEDRDLSQYGVLNAVTRTSQDVADYDRATELERLGGTILELPRADWRKIAEAA